MKLGETIKTEDFKKEKHVPVVEIPEKIKASEVFNIKVSVGKEVPHPNTTEHHISWIKVFFKPDDEQYSYEVGSFEFTAHGEAIGGPNTGPLYTEPIVSLSLKLAKNGTILALSYCNIHGLWENSAKITLE
ncbi:MAG: class II SORL domain-containing protein [bacterium]